MIDKIGLLSGATLLVFFLLLGFLIIKFSGGNELGVLCGLVAIAFSTVGFFLMILSITQ